MLTKSPEAILDYSICWPRAVLLGVPIEASDWDCRPEGLSIEPAETEPGTTAARIAGGSPGTRYRLINRVTLADDRTLVRTLELEAAR